MKAPGLYRLTWNIFAMFLLAALGVLCLAGVALAQADADDDDDDDDDDDSTPPLEKRTLFVIGTHTNFFNFPLMAYVIVDDQIYLADTWNARSHDVGPTGLAVDETNENLFVSYEGYNGIEVFDARDATPLGTIILYGTSDLCGIVVHQDRGHLYVVDRAMPNVFVYDTTSFQQVDSWILDNTNGAWGIDLMGNWLFVGDGTSTVRWYDIDTQTEVGNFTQSWPAIGIAVTDWPEPTVYSAAFLGASSPYFTKYQINTGIETLLATGTNSRGVSLNPALNQAYLSADNAILTIDTETMTIIQTTNLNWTWAPCDVLASFVPFGGTVKKTCTSHPNGKIYKGDTVEFKVALQNRHNLPIHQMSVRDTYDNTQLFFESANPPADDANDDGQLDWADLIAQIGADLPTGEWAEILVTYTAIEDCEGTELTGVNTALMHNVEDIEGFSLPDASGQFDYIINCNCRTNLDCDDGVFCNGAEICNADGTCSSPGNPCPLDDGLWCNGDETADCNEELDECGHENAPCVDDADFCNGQEVCNENTDTCTNSGPPCHDDGQFCNGEESCDSQASECVSSGNPCQPGEECNEVDDTCGEVEPGDDDDTPEPGDKDEDLWPEGKVTGGCCGCD